MAKPPAQEDHSLFSASGAEGWSWCHGKPAMEEGRKSSSFYADEGTAAHTLASWVLVSRIADPTGGTTAANFIGQDIKVRRFDGPTKKWITRTFTVDSEMAEHVDEYVDRFFTFANSAKAERFCEQRVNYSEYLGTPKDLAWGTSDGVAILWDQDELEWTDPTTEETRWFPPGDELQVHDLKYGGGVQVFADTLQLKCYGAGTYFEWEHLANFTRVRLVIHQPRKEHVDELVITPAELLKAVQGLRPAVPRVIEAHELAKALREEGLSDLEVGERLHARGFLKVSEKGCKFCDAKAVCPAKIEEVTEGFAGRAAKADDFDDLTVDTRAEVAEYGHNYLVAAFSKLEAIEDWAKAVRAEIDRRVLMKGEKFPGVKVVAGKKGRREWTNKGAVEAFVAQLAPAIRTLMLKQDIKSPAQAEKALKQTPSTWARLQAFIDQAEGKPSVVHESDKRPPISHKALAEDFDDLTEAEETPTPPRGVAARGVTRHPFR